MPNGLEKYLNFIINNKFSFINSFQLLRSSLDSLVKTLGRVDFQYLNQAFNNNVLDLVKQKGLCPYGYMTDFEKFKEQLSSKERVYNSLTGESQ